MDSKVVQRWRNAGLGGVKSATVSFSAASITILSTTPLVVPDSGFGLLLRLHSEKMMAG